MTLTQDSAPGDDTARPVPGHVRLTIDGRSRRPKGELIIRTCERLGSSFPFCDHPCSPRRARAASAWSRSRWAAADAQAAGQLHDDGRDGMVVKTQHSSVAEKAQEG
jgi:hypothetical protein